MTTLRPFSPDRSDVTTMLSLVMNHPKLAPEDAMQILRVEGGDDVFSIVDLKPEKYQAVIDSCVIVLALASDKVEGRLISEARHEAYDAIDSERDYQDTNHPHPTSLPGYLMVLEKLLADAKHAWYYDNDNLDVVRHMRKLAAVAVHVMEIHGVELRQEDPEPGFKEPMPFLDDYIL
jgi:hypothetical protein